MGHTALRSHPLPSWIRSKKTNLETEREMKRLLRDHGTHTICEEARCPNRSECFSLGTATFLLLGEHCTRNCGFCSVKSGSGMPVRKDEIRGIVEATRSLELTCVVITMVTRDDLEDGGASHIAACIRSLKQELPGIKVEILSSDLGGRACNIQTVLDAEPDVFAHNLETVPRLSPTVRPRADYRRSLEVIKTVRRLHPEIILKSGLIAGMGEEEEEIISVMRELRSAGCDVFTIGQYLQPSRNCLPVNRYWPPEAFERWKKEGIQMGFSHVFSGPFVRSSYRAGDIFL